MQSYNFTERVRWALACAREEAARLRHEYVGPEHVLLGLLGQDSSVALSVIESFGVVPGDLRTRVETVVKAGRADVSGSDLPFTSRAKKVLELAMAEARYLNDSYVGTQHLLLGLIHEEQGIPSVLLGECGITLDAARQHTVDVLGAGKPDDEAIGNHEASMNASRMRARRRASTEALAASEVASGPMAASVIEALTTHGDVAAVFAAQGIDVAKLAAALRAASRPAPPAA